VSEVQTSGKKVRPSLFGTVGKAPSATDHPDPAATDKEPPKAPTPRAAVRGRQDRQDKRQIAGFFSAECAKQLRMLAAEQDTTVQDLIKEGLNLMFSAHGKPPIA
jgi:hypothetical protein